MTLTDTIRMVEVMAGGQPPVKSIVRNDIFRLNSLPDAKYSVFGWTQGQHTANLDSSFITYRFTFFYIDRLTADQSNEVEIQSVGIQTLDNIIRTLNEMGVWSEGTWTAQTFNQRFLDECAGVWATVRLLVPQGWTCAEGWPDFGDDFSDDFRIE